jgi:hypothetical protein
MTQNKVSDCCSAKMVPGKKTEQRDFQFGQRNPKYYQVDCLACTRCSKPCTPVEAKVGPQGDSSGITPIQEAAGKVSKHFGRAIEKLGGEAKHEECVYCEGRIPDFKPGGLIKVCAEHLNGSKPPEESCRDFDYNGMCDKPNHNHDGS